MKNDVQIGKAKVKKLTIGEDNQTGQTTGANDDENRVRIDELESDNTVIGRRIYSSEQMQAGLAVCQTRISETLGEDTPPAVTQALTEAASEAKKDKPDGKSVLEKLETASSALKNLGEVAEKAAKVAPLMTLLSAVYAGAKAWLGVP
jgi:hypothetical protein